MPTVADRPIRWRSRPASRPIRCKQRQQVPAAVVAGEGVDLVDHDGAHAGEQRGRGRIVAETSITSSDSGVVSRQSGGSSRIRFFAEAGTSPCQTAARRPTRP